MIVSFISLFVYIVGFSLPQPFVLSETLTFDSIGLMPEIVVTAPRYENADDAWSGLMPEVLVTAPRHVGDGVGSEMEEDKPKIRVVDRQSFNIDINILIILIVLVSMALIIGLFVFSCFLRKCNIPRKQLCDCHKPS